jgi:lipoprotein-anchoring transpeptidase ErfK/SrfK
MFRKIASALMLSASLLVAGLGDKAAAQYATQAAYNNGSSMGGGFIEFLFGGHQQQTSPYHQPYQPPQYAPQVQPYHQPQYQAPYQRQPMYQDEREQAYEPATPARPEVDPKYLKQMVSYPGREPAGTIVIDTPSKFLYLVQDDGRALRYGIGVGRPGFTWSGVKTVSMKKEWPSWTPPAEMLKRRPDLPRFMEGGPENPLGARAMYLGSSLYRIHGSNEPWTIGTSVSSGCIRMRNEDVIDLYNRVKVGTRVVVI